LLPGWCRQNFQTKPRRDGRGFLFLVRLSAVIAGSAALCEAQLQVGGALIVNVDATGSPTGPLTRIANNGTVGRYFEARVAGFARGFFIS